MQMCLAADFNFSFSVGFQVLKYIYVHDFDFELLESKVVAKL